MFIRLRKKQYIFIISETLSYVRTDVIKENITRIRLNLNPYEYDSEKNLTIDLHLILIRLLYRS